MAGPFYTFSDEQWRAVRETHRRFIEDKAFGRPLMLNPYAWNFEAEQLPKDPIVFAGPKTRRPEVDEGLRRDILQAWRISRSAGRCDAFPDIRPIRNHYGHSQRLAEPFGGAPYMEAGHCQAFPVIHDLSAVRTLKPKPITACRYMSAGLDLLRYLHASTEGRYPIRQMVTTGALDTVNYLTGTTLLLEGLYTHPKEVHQLLRMTTDMLIEHILACREAVGGNLVPDHTSLISGYALCSELRSQISAAHYEEFEAPYLKAIGDAVGPLIVHSSGRWEQTIPATLADPNIFHIVLWVRDTDLAETTAMIGDRISIEAWRTDLEQFGFADAAGFYRYIFAGIRPETRLAFSFGLDLAGYAAAYDEAERAGSLPPQFRRMGRVKLWTDRPD